MELEVDWLARMEKTKPVFGIAAEVVVVVAAMGATTAFVDAVFFLL